MYFKVRARNCIFKENVLSSFKLIFFVVFCNMFVNSDQCIPTIRHLGNHYVTLTSSD